MKNFTKALFAILFFAFAYANSFAATSGIAKEDTIVIKTMIYCDHCLECEDCKGNLVDELITEKGIFEAKLDAEKMTLTVVYNPKKTSPKDIRIAVSKLGYDADDIHADPVAVAKLDGCCKKP